MPKKVVSRTPAVIEEVSTEPAPVPAPAQVVVEKPKRTRTMTPEALQKLKIARELALKAKKEGKKINQELEQAKKETFSEKIDQVETYKKLKSKVEEEVKQNEIVAINQKIADMHSKFDAFLEDRQKRKQEKAQKKEEKRASEIAAELPRAISQKILEEEVKKQELQRLRNKLFGIRVI